jgi:hypothetical protein
MAVIGSASIEKTDVTRRRFGKIRELTKSEAQEKLAEILKPRVAEVSATITPQSLSAHAGGMSISRNLGMQRGTQLYQPSFKTT